MVEATVTGQLARLEDFVELAREGKKVKCDIDLRKQSLSQRVHPEETPDRTDEIETYLLIGDYTFLIDKQSYKVSKVYMFATEEESLNSARVNKSIANSRLQMDYERLKAARVTFKERFF